MCRFLAIQQVYLKLNIQNYVLWVYIKEVKLPVFSLTLRFHFKPFFHCFHPHVSSTNVHVKSPRSVSIDKLICFVQNEYIWHKQLIEQNLYFIDRLRLQKSSNLKIKFFSLRTDDGARARRFNLKKKFEIVIQQNFPAIYENRNIPSFIFIRYRKFFFWGTGACFVNFWQFMTKYQNGSAIIQLVRLYNVEF